MGSNKRQNHEWVVVAAREFMKIIRYLGLKSINQASKELHINYRTLKKLDERKPDPTLKLESLFGIWNSLKVFAIVQSPERAVEEEKANSRFFDVHFGMLQSQLKRARHFR